MKIIATLLFLIAFNANAEWMFHTKNNAGGQIVLLDYSGNCANKMLRMYAAASNGEIFWGCWTATDLHVMVVYDHGNTRAYDFSNWVPNEKHPALKPKNFY